MSAPGTAVAFFDIDETLITVKSMVDFDDHLTAVLGPDTGRRAEHRAELIAAVRARVPRAEVNRMFYRGFAGLRADELAELGRAWFQQRLAQGGLFHEEVLDALRGHLADGLRVALVSGSFSACLDPIAAYTGATDVFGTGVEVRDGVLTGELTHSMIGPAKAAAVTRLLDALGARSADCHGYGDHHSDLDMLELVGHPVVVGRDPVMVREAERRGWDRIVPAARPAPVGSGS